MEFAIDLLNADQIDAILSVYASVADWATAVYGQTCSIVIDDFPF